MGGVLSVITSRATARPDLVLHTGQVFEGYRIRRMLDSGGMGAVYEASEVASDDLVAIKLLLPGHAKREDFVRRFQQECRIYPKLKHPNIVRMRRADVSREGVPFIVMDLLEGPTLRALMDKHSFDVLNALYVMSQVAHAMQFAHEKGIEHRDLKPENLMIATRGEEKGHVYVLDFGIARMAGGMATDELPVLGTARYMAPEQVRSLFRSAGGGRREKTDHRVDIYAFGLIFYELITGRHTFINDSERAKPLSLEETLAGHLEAEPPPVHTLAYGCPTSVWEVIRRCIAVDPGARYQSFQEVVEALRELINEVIESERVPREHALVRQLEEEKAHAVQRAAFEVIAQKEAAAEAAAAAAEAAAEAAVTAEAAVAAGGAVSGREPTEVRRAPQTAPLGDFVPTTPLPFQIKAPAEAVPVPSGRGRGFTVRIPRAASEQDASSARRATSPTSPTAPLPVGRGCGFTVKIPRPSEPTPRPEEEAGAAAAPEPRRVTEEPWVRSLTPARMRTRVAVMMGFIGLGTLLSAAALVIALRAERRVQWVVAAPAGSTPLVSALLAALVPAAGSSGGATPEATAAPSAATPLAAAPSAPAPSPPKPSARPAAVKRPVVRAPSPSLSPSIAPSSVKASAPPPRSVLKPAPVASTAPPRPIFFFDFKAEPPSQSEGRR